MKAVFLLYLGKFVEWPKEAFTSNHDPIVLCILGDDPFDHGELNAIKGKSVNGRKLIINKFRYLDDIRTCHILFVSASEKGSVRKIIQYFRHTPVLLVGEIPRFAHLGGMVNLVIHDSRVALEINKGAAKKAGLQMSSKLLSSARIIEDSP